MTRVFFLLFLAAACSSGRQDSVDVGLPLDGDVLDGDGLDAPDGSALDGGGADGGAPDGSASDGGASDGGASDGSAPDGALDGAVDGGDAGLACVAEEFCDGDGVDEDCDGEVDEGCGECPIAHVRCVDGCCEVPETEIAANGRFMVRAGAR